MRELDAEAPRAHVRTRAPDTHTFHFVFLYPEKNPRSKDDNQQQTQPTYDTGTGNRTRATLVEGECSHHCAIPATPTAREWRDSAEPRLRDAECHEVSVAKIMEHSNSRTKCNNITCLG